MNQFFLAPMAELSTIALRRAVKKFTKNITLFSEMLSAGAIVAKSLHNEPLLQKSESEEPFIFQIVGNSPEKMSDAAKILQERGCFGIDVNMGCPAPDIVKRGFGSKLLDDINLSKKIILECRRVVKGTLSVKMRSGFESYNSEKLLSFAKMLQLEGVDFITIHPRFAKQYYTRSADWSVIKFLKDNLSIPILGNGDVVSSNDAVNLKKRTGCDGIMIGREAVKSPWIFKACEEKISGNSNSFEVDVHEIFRDILLGIEEFLPENLQKSRAYRFASFFSKNVVFGHQLFTKIRNLDKISEMLYVVDGYFERNPHEKIKIVD